MSLPMPVVEVAVAGRRYDVVQASGLGSVVVAYDAADEQTAAQVAALAVSRWPALRPPRAELPLLSVDRYSRTVVRARWLGHPATVLRRADDGRVVIALPGGARQAARERGFHGDVRDGWIGGVHDAELTDVEVDTTAYDVPAMLAAHHRPSALDDALVAAGLPVGAIAWTATEGTAVERLPEGRWAIVATRTGFQVGAVGRGRLAVYQSFPAGRPAVELAVALVGDPLRRVARTTPDLDERGRQTGLAVLERTAARGGTAGPTGLRPGDLLDCLGPETGHHLYALGTPFAARSQPPSDVGAARLCFRVARPLPSEVAEGTAAPWFGQPGGGAMVVLDRPIRWYVDAGDLEPVGEPMEERAAAFLDGLDRLPAWAGVSYRGLPAGPLPAVGTTITALGVTPTTRDPRVATENFTVGGVWAVNGRSGRAVEQLSADVAAREVVFRPGSFFRVVRVARVGATVVVLLEDEAVWEGDLAETSSTPDDFAAVVATQVQAARRRDEVTLSLPGRFVGPIG